MRFPVRIAAAFLCLLPSVAWGQATLPPVNLGAILDAPLDQVQSPYLLCGASRLVGNYRGPLYQLRRESDGALIDVYAPFSAVRGWPLKASLTSFLAGAPGFVAKCYDQSGNGRTLDMSALPNNQPYLDTEGANPVFSFDGRSARFDLPSAVTQNVSGLTVLAERKHDVTWTTNTDRPIFYTSAGSGGTRTVVGPNIALATDGAGGRRADADTLTRTPGFPVALGWDVEVARFDYANAVLKHQRGALTETLSPFLSAGTSANTASTNAAIGGQPGSINYFYGKMAAFAVYQSVLTDVQIATATATLPNLALPAFARPSQFLDWGSQYIRGPYTLAPTIASATVLGTASQSPAPPAANTINGATPTAGDLLSHRYHHHTRIAIQNGRLWIAYSSGLNNEDAQGQLAVVSTSTDYATASTPTFTPPAIAIPPQDTMGDVVDGGRLVWPRAFVKYAGNLYLVSAVNYQYNTGLALLAVKCNDDGTVGTPFLVSTEAYTPVSGFPTYNYDGTLGPPIFQVANVFGIWGGSNAGYPASSFIGSLSYGSTANFFLEPNTFPIDASGQNLQRLWRKFGTTGSLNNYWWSQRSSDGGQSWTPISMSNIPNQASAGTAIRLSDGRIAMAANAIDYDTVNKIRDPLYLALYNGTTGALGSLYAIRQGLSSTPTYAGTYKSGAAAYPGIATDGTYLYFSYSLQKESIGFSRVPLAGL